MLNLQSRTADKGWSSSLVLGEVLTTPHRKYRYICLGPGLILGTTKAMEIWYESWYMEPVLVKDTYDSCQKISKEQIRSGYMVQRGCTYKSADYIFFMENETKIINWKQTSFSPQKSISSLGLLVIGCHISLFWICVHQLRRNVMTQKKACVRKESKFWVIFLSAVWKVC